jgi:hypothetical protein
MVDPFKGHRPGLSSPADNGAEVTPSDAGELPAVTRALYSGSGGDIAVRLASGTLVRLTETMPGSIYPLRVDKVLATGTTASGIVGFW